MGPNDVVHVVVRHEASTDQARVEAVVRDAFGQAAEVELVARLRTVPGGLSLVGVVDGVVVGHAMFTPVTSRAAATDSAAYGLAPVAVAPDRQRRGVGFRLISEGIAELRRSGAGLVVVLGHREYYPRFGFVAAAPLGLSCKWGGEDGSFQVLELVPGAARVHRGRIDYHRAFDAFA